MKINLKKTPSSERDDHAAYMRTWRAKMTTDQKKKNADQSKIRMKKYRERKALEKAGKKETPQTRQEEKKEEERKSIQRRKKALYRANLSAQKKRRIKEKDAHSKRQKRAAVKESSGSKSQSPSIPSLSKDDHEMSGSFKKFVYRHCKMPKSPTRYAKVMKRLATNVTPKRKAAMEAEGIIDPQFCKKNLVDVLDAVKEASESLKGRTDDQKSKRRKFFQMFKSLNKSKETQQLFCCTTGIKKKYLSSKCFEETPRKRREDALQAETQKAITDFYENEMNSISIPDRKAVKKDLEPKKVLQTSLSTAFQTWTEENSNKKVSYSTFCKLKPKHVLPQKNRKLYQCLCEYCENVKLKLKCLQVLADNEQAVNRELIKDEYSAVKNSLCDVPDGEKFAKLDCIDRKCDNCGIWLLKRKIQPILQKQKQMKWSRWEQVKTVNKKTNKDIVKQQLVSKTGPIMALWEELEAELQTLSTHLFEARWQQQQFSLLHTKENFPRKTVSLTMDFAENFTCFSQNEVQAAHWTQDSVTLHPVIARYRCPECNDDIIEESIDVVSDDLTHDCHAVHTFTDKVFSYIKNTRQIDIERAVIISDGCAAQYKSKVPFMDVSYSMDDYDVSVERCYYGSRHGKNRCDGEAGVIKSKARRAIKSGAIIKDALTFFEVVKSLEKTPTGTPCKHSLRKILFVYSHEIQRERPDRNAKTLAGTRKIHSLRGLSRGEIATRRLSCFCEECVSLKYEKCLNTQHVDKWKTTKMRPLVQNAAIPAPPAPAIPAPPAPAIPAPPAPAIPVPPAPAIPAPLVPAIPAQPAPAIPAQPAPAIPVPPAPTIPAPPAPDKQAQPASTQAPSEKAATTSSVELPLDLDFLEIESCLDTIDIDIQNVSISSNCSFSEVQSYPEGTFIKVQHGTEMYPAVVDGWPWVKYFYQPRPGYWAMQETRHTLLPVDVVGVLPPPDIHMSGCRFFYIFKDL